MNTAKSPTIWFVQWSITSGLAPDCREGALLKAASQAVGGGWMGGGGNGGGARMQPTATRGPDVGFAGDNIVTADILAHQVLLNRVPEQATEDSVKYQIYY